VDRADALAAGLRSLSGRTSLATELRSLDDRADMRLLTSTTSLGAASPGTPLAHNTVNRTTLFVTEAYFTKVAALGTTVGSSSSDGTKAVLETHAARLGAFRESTPGR